MVSTERLNITEYRVATSKNLQEYQTVGVASYIVVGKVTLIVPNTFYAGPGVQAVILYVVSLRLFP